MGSSSWQRSLSRTKSSPGVKVSNRSRIFLSRFLNGLQFIHDDEMSRDMQKILSHLKSSGKSAVSLSTLSGPVGKTTNPQTIARRGMANIRLQIYLLGKSNIWGESRYNKGQYNVIDSILVSLFVNVTGTEEKYNWSASHGKIQKNIL